MIELREVLAREVVEVIRRVVTEEVVQAVADLRCVEDSPWLSRIEAAAYVHVSVRTLDRYLKAGRVRCEYLGSRPLLHRDDLDALVRSWRGK